MKIAFINIYQGKVDRGVETFVAEVSKRLKENHTVDIISGGEIDVPEWEKNFLWRAFLDPNSIAIAKFTLGILPRIWREKYDVVVPLNGGWQPAFTRIVAWLYGGKMVISGQSGKGWHERNNLWSFPDVFVALTIAAKRWSGRVNPFVRVEKVPNGVDTKKFINKGKALDFKLPKPVFLCVAALNAMKRQELAIKAVAKISGASLVLVGDGPDRNRLMEMGSRLLPGRFSIESFPYSDLPMVYRSADVFTFPTSPFESFGIVMLEALATNLPVVVTDDPTRREIAGDAGIFVDPMATEKYVAALKMALNKNWVSVPRTRAKEFDWDIIAKKYEDLFQSLVKEE